MKIKLKTGREFEANGSIVGIDDEGETFNGYDGTLGHDWNDDIGDDQPWPVADRIALAELMIERWTAYLNKAKGEPDA